MHVHEGREISGGGTGIAIDEEQRHALPDGQPVRGLHALGASLEFVVDRPDQTHELQHPIGVGRFHFRASSSSRRPARSIWNRTTKMTMRPTVLTKARVSNMTALRVAIVAIATTS